MKRRKLFVSIIWVLTILLAFPCVISAIEFDAEEKYDSVFVITSGNSLGSGFAIGENCIVTNAHVIDNPNDIKITTYAGQRHAAYLVGYDQDRDIAVLGVHNIQFVSLQLADYNNANVGEDVYAIGAPKSMAYTLTKGVISAKNREVGGYKYIQTDSAINEGNSGGPLLNQAGQVIGMNTLKLSNSEGIGLAIPMTVVREFVQSLDIKIDTNGNVIEPVIQEGELDNGNEESTSSGSDKKILLQHTSIDTLILLVALCGSVALNILFVVILIFQRKKNINLKFDPRERTDFDIDILE